MFFSFYKSDLNRKYFYTPDIQEVRRYFQEKNSSNQKIQKSMTKTLEINEKRALIRVNKIISINIVV